MVIGIQRSKIMGQFVLTFVFLVIGSQCAFAKKLNKQSDAIALPAVVSLPASVYETQNLPLLENKDYLALQILYEPVKNVYEQLKAKYPGLITRGEAHITVVTPPEFKKFHGVSIADVQQFARDQKMQSCEFKIQGLGHGQVQKDENFFLVVDSVCLWKFRQSLKQHFKLQDFDPDHFYAHITVGYTRRDLHEQDGVIKNAKSIDPAYELRVIQP